MGVTFVLVYLSQWCSIIDFESTIDSIEIPRTPWKDWLNWFFVIAYGCQLAHRESLKVQLMLADPRKERLKLRSLYFTTNVTSAQDGNFRLEPNWKFRKFWYKCRNSFMLHRFSIWNMLLVVLSWCELPKFCRPTAFSAPWAGWAAINKNRKKKKWPITDNSIRDCLSESEMSFFF